MVNSAGYLVSAQVAVGTVVQSTEGQVCPGVVDLHLHEVSEMYDPARTSNCSLLVSTIITFLFKVSLFAL